MFVAKLLVSAAGLIALVKADFPGGKGPWSGGGNGDGNGWSPWSGSQGDDNCWFAGKDVCGSYDTDTNFRDSAWSCINDAWDDKNDDDDSWSNCGGIMGGFWGPGKGGDWKNGDWKSGDGDWKSGDGDWKSGDWSTSSWNSDDWATKTSDPAYSSCYCSWLLGPQANCIASACATEEYGSFTSSVSSQWGCSGSPPTDAPSATVIGAALNAQEGSPANTPGLARETAVPLGMAAGIIGAALLL